MLTVASCERENEWLDEAQYRIQTPRRSSIIYSEETGVAMNRRDSSMWKFAAPEDMSVSAEKYSSNNNNNNYDANMLPTNGNHWSMLSPVPATPAPDAVARYAASLATNDNVEEYEEEDYDLMDIDSPEEMRLQMQQGGQQQPAGAKTCPPKPVLGNIVLQPPGTGLAAGSRDFGISQSTHKDGGVLMRLMAAKRKSMQFAPKVGSPLAKSWK